MIPKDFITAWRAYAPWPRAAQVEQDLIRPPARYSEVGQTSDRLRHPAFVSLYQFLQGLRMERRRGSDLDVYTQR